MPVTRGSERLGCRPSHSPPDGRGVHRQSLSLCSTCTNCPFRVTHTFTLTYSFTMLLLNIEKKNNHKKSFLQRKYSLAYSGALVYDCYMVKGQPSIHTSSVCRITVGFSSILTAGSPLTYDVSEPDDITDPSSFHKVLAYLKENDQNTNYMCTSSNKSTDR